MSLRHKTNDVCGIQFHPESILTPNGKQILKNWIYSSFPHLSGASRHFFNDDISSSVI